MSGEMYLRSKLLNLTGFFSSLGGSAANFASIFDILDYLNVKGA